MTVLTTSRPTDYSTAIDSFTNNTNLAWSQYKYCHLSQKYILFINKANLSSFYFLSLYISRIGNAHLRNVPKTEVAGVIIPHATQFLHKDFQYTRSSDKVIITSLMSTQWCTLCQTISYIDILNNPFTDVKQVIITGRGNCPM